MNLTPFHSAKPEPVVFQIDDQWFPPLPSATFPPVTAATTSQPSYASAVKQFHSANPGPVVFQIDDQSTAATISAEWNGLIAEVNVGDGELLQILTDFALGGFHVAASDL
jgi:hypothetical protein